MQMEEPQQKQHNLKAQLLLLLLLPATHLQSLPLGQVQQVAMRLPQ
jgi:hypothetical protein